MTAAVRSTHRQLATDRSGANLRQRLRAATVASHARLDALFRAYDLRERNGYRRFLEASAGALLPLEAALVMSGVDEFLANWPERARSDAILADLASVGGAACPLPAPRGFTPGTMLGTLYVLEGSRLGAKVLLPLVESARDPLIAGATAYLRHGEGRPLWSSFLSLLERHAGALESENDASENDAIAGAHLAFDLFAQAAVRA